MLDAVVVAYIGKLRNWVDRGIPGVFFCSPVLPGRRGTVEGLGRRALMSDSRAKNVRFSWNGHRNRVDVPIVRFQVEREMLMGMRRIL